MLIERRDQVVNVCEMKFTLNPYVISGKYLREMTERMESFRCATNTASALHLTMISAAGVADNEYSGAIQDIITLKDLFKAL